MKKTVGVITFGNSINYGGVLQAEALNYILKELGFIPVFITHQKMKSAWNSPCRYVQLRVHKYGSKGIVTKLRILGGISKVLFSNILIFQRMRKIDNFKEFIDNNLDITPYYETQEELVKFCSGYDFYITGSDQVWNDAFNLQELDQKYVLKFVPSNKPKFSYAASAGGYKGDPYIKKLVELTKDFSGISVREKSLEKQMRRLGAENVETVLDPTLLLTTDEWIGMEKKINIPEHYILVYYLEPSTQLDLLIDKTFKKYNLPVVDLLPGYAKTKFKILKYSTLGPAEFIYCFHHADYVITNSFHGTVFSILFNKQFLTVPRSGQESRMIDLLNELKLSERLAKGKEIDVLDKRIIYKTVKDLIELKKQSSLRFLRQMLEMEL